MTSKTPWTPGLSGKGERPRYRASPQARFEHQTEVRIRERFQGIAEADVSRQHAGSGGHSTLDRALVVFPFEMTYPGRRDDVTMTFRRKWIYAFDVKSRKCILEGRSHTLRTLSEDIPFGLGDFFRYLQEKIGTEFTFWNYRVGVLKPASFDGDAPLKESSLAGVAIPPDLVKEQTGLAFFLSPHRLSQRAIEFLIEKLKVRKSDPDFPFAMVWWNDTTLGHVTLCDPYRWAAEAAQKYYVREVEQWQKHAHDPEENAKIYIAKVVKAWRDAKVAKVEKQIFKGVADWYVEGAETKRKELHKEAEVAAAYTIQCIDSPEHRAVEIAAEDFGGAALADTLANYAIVLQGMALTGPGVIWVNTLAEDRERVPWKYVMSDAPPSNCPDYASDARAYYPATVILETLGTTVLRSEMQSALEGGATAGEASLRALGKLRERLDRIYAGRATFSFHETTTAVTVTAEPMWRADADPDGVRTRRREELTYSQLAYKYAASHTDAEALDPSSDFVSESYKWGTSSAALFATSAAFFNPLGPFVSVTNLATAVSAWRSRVSKDETVLVWPFEVQADTLGLISAITSTASSAIDIAGLNGDLVEEKTMKVLRRRVLGASGVLAMVGGVLEVAGSSKKAGEAIFGKRNYMEGAGHAFVAVGAAVSAVGGAFSLGAAIVGTASLSGPAGFVLGVAGAAVAFVGSLMVSEYSTTPLSEFVKFSFLGTERKASPGEVEVSWFDERLPIGGPVKQAALLTYLLSSFTMRRVGHSLAGTSNSHGYPSIHRGASWLVVGGRERLTQRREADCEPLIQIDLGYFPVGSRLDLEIIQRYPRSPIGSQGLYRPKGYVSFVHDRPGRLVKLDRLEYSEIMFGTAEYLVDDRAIRALRMELRPLVFGRVNAPMTNNTMRDWREHCTGCLVKARISIGGQSMMFKSMPKVSGWVGIHVFGEEPSPVSSLNPGSYIKGEEVS